MVFLPRHRPMARLSGAKVRKSEHIAIKINVFFCFVERKYLLKTRFTRISVASAERDEVKGTKK